MEDVVATLILVWATVVTAWLVLLSRRLKETRVSFTNRVVELENDLKTLEWAVLVKK